MFLSLLGLRSGAGTPFSLLPLVFRTLLSARLTKEAVSQLCRLDSAMTSAPGRFRFLCREEQSEVGFVLKW